MIITDHHSAGIALPIAFWFISSPSAASLDKEETDPEETNFDTVTIPVTLLFHVAFLLTKLPFH